MRITPDEYAFATTDAGKLLVGHDDEYNEGRFDTSRNYCLLDDLYEFQYKEYFMADFQAAVLA